MVKFEFLIRVLSRIIEVVMNEFCHICESVVSVDIKVESFILELVELESVRLDVPIIEFVSIVDWFIVE